MSNQLTKQDENVLQAIDDVISLAIKTPPTNAREWGLMKYAALVRIKAELPDLLKTGNLRQANIERNKEWSGGEPLPLEFRGLELAGECGEACNVIKKLSREKRGMPGSRATKQDLANEMADVIIAADLVMMDAEIDLFECVTRKFNETTRKHGFKTYL